jgi:hypothetical protein
MSMCNPYHTHKFGYIERTKVSNKIRELQQDPRVTQLSTGTPSAADASNDVPNALDHTLKGCRLHSTVLGFLRIRH